MLSLIHISEPTRLALGDVYKRQFKAPYEGLLLAEVEFPTEEAAHAYQPPKWFGEDVTYSTEYHNSTLSKGKKR